MASNLLFLSKVLVLSTVLAIAIKTIGPTLVIPANTTNALLSVFSLPVLLFVVLLVRAGKMPST